MRIRWWLGWWFGVPLWPVLAGAQTNYIPLHSFGTSNLSGAHPVAELLEGSDGALYGTAGTVFKLNKDGSGARTLHTFGASQDDGSNPMAGLVELSDGALYGTTTYGGTGSGSGFGTVFKLNTDGSGYQIIHRFGIQAGDAKYPDCVLTAVGEMLYGTTMNGGSSDLGSIFKLNTDGTGYMVVYSFKGGNDIAQPRKGLVQASDGALYGRAAYCSNSFAGAIFKIKPDGSGYTILRTFAETGGDAAGPWGLLEGTDGMLYGTSFGGGASGYGTLVKMAKDGRGYLILRSFVHDGSDGIQPQTLHEGADGVLYGTTAQGGRYEGGTAFKINKDGSGYTILRNFRNGNEAGWHPGAGVMQGRDGVWYGTTYYSVGDGLGPGVVFALSLQPRSWFTAWALGAQSVTSLDARGAADALFRLQAGTSLASSGWQDIATNSANALGMLRFTNLPEERPGLFYRLVAE